MNRLAWVLCLMGVLGSGFPGMGQTSVHLIIGN